MIVHPWSIQGFVKERNWSYCDFFSESLLSNQITNTDIVKQSEASKSELVSSLFVNEMSEEVKSQNEKSSSPLVHCIGTLEPTRQHVVLNSERIAELQCSRFVFIM